MTFMSRFRARRYAARVAAVFVGVWLYAALSPCLMAMDHPCGNMDDGKTCMQAADPCGLAAVDCKLADSNPPTAATIDLHAPMPVVLFTLPADEPLTPVPTRHRARVNSDLPGPLHPLLHVRLLI